MVVSEVCKQVFCATHIVCASQVSHVYLCYLNISSQ